MTFIRSLLFAIWFYLTLLVLGLLAMPIALFSRRFAIGAVRLFGAAQTSGLNLSLQRLSEEERRNER